MLHIGKVLQDAAVEKGVVAMSVTTLEARVALLEQEVLQLKRRLPKPAAAPWWEQISGVFADTPAFEAAAELGRQYREAQISASDEDVDVSA